MFFKRLSFTASSALALSGASLAPAAAQNVRVAQVHVGGYTGRVLRNVITGG